jgi:hypothetical protein
MLDANVREGRINSAKSHNVAGWTGDTTVIEFSITDAKAKELGYNLDDTGDFAILCEKVNKDGTRLNGLYMMNENCPVAENIDELTELCGLLGTDLLKLGNAKIRTEYQNKCRGFLNAPAESAKAIAERQAKAVKQEKAKAISDAVASGDITMEQAFVQMQALL